MSKSILAFFQTILYYFMIALPILLIYILVMNILKYLTQSLGIFIKPACAIDYYTTQFTDNFIHFLIGHLLPIHIHVETAKAHIRL